MIGGWLDNIKMLWRYGFTSPMNAQKLYVNYSSHTVFLSQDFFY